VAIGPVRQHTAEHSEEPVTLRIYPGADGRFSWYEDDGTSFRYRQGEFTKIDCAWDDASRKLTLAWAAGSRPSSERKVWVQAMDHEAKKLVTVRGHITTVNL